MNPRARLRRQREAAMLMRMEVTRVQLLAANVGSRLNDQAAKTPGSSLTLPNIGRALFAAPNVTLLGSVVLGSLLVGPKRIVPLVLRSGLPGLIARRARVASSRSTLRAP
ncbi:hypothetical protein [Paraburkholderia acidisoli]|uniref:Uncharacterized protein n=1 Tax=Paraburkholderia acidisoli TaxID=2571748 RepID=A0A7Z2JGM0_9BURK|nr:hypothetical protein [Paraburkholderia acidisoli]QGZ63143.1 hypothetical protein FAZ98_15135 [Paraburkholderia acidisoli]